jgi:hypothetical protein
MMFVTKIFIAATLISFASWLSGKRPELAGFIIALPLTTMLALAFSFAEYRDPAASVTFAKSVFVAIPVSMLFFVPFLLAERFHLGFLAAYGIGLVLLTGGYFIHRSIVGFV